MVNCPYCGVQLEPNEQICPECRQADTGVRRITETERRSFQGITLEQDVSHAGSRFEDRQSYGGVHFINLSSGKMGFLTKCLFGVIALAVIVFAFSSIAVFTIAGLIFYLFLRIFRR